VHTVTLCGVTAVLAIAAALTWWDAEAAQLRPRAAATLLLITGAALAAYTAMQCVPMPIALLAKIAPRNADIWSRALMPLHEAGPSWAPLSLDPTATRVEALKAVAYLLAFVTALRLARTRDGVAFLSNVIVMTGLALAATALLHPAFGAHRLYGVWTPSAEAQTHPKHMAPFLNPNNLAAYLNVAFCLAFAATLAPDPRWPRPLLAGAALFLASTQIWVASRGGVATLVLGAGLVAFVSRGRWLKRQEPRALAGTSMLLGLAVIAGAFMLILGSAEDSTSELFDTDTTKFLLAKEALRMVPAYSIFGTGRGAFESTFPAFRDSPGIWTFTYPENVVLQWLIEWGIPVGFAGLVAIVIGLRPNSVLVRSSTASGAWAGLVAVAMQNLVDLGSEIPGLVLAAVVCAAIVVGGTAGRDSRWGLDRWSKSPRIVALGSAIVASCAVAAALFAMGGELNDDRQTLEHAAAASQGADGALHTLARTAMLRHPAEPYLPFVVGWHEGHERSDGTIPWIEATLERAQAYGPAHLVLARFLARRAPAQARMEYRLAFEQGPELVWVALGETTRLVGGYYDALELAPAAQANPAILRQLVEALGARLPATCARLDAEIMVRTPADSGPSLRAARNALEDLDAGEAAPWCGGPARRGCVKVALDSAARAEQLAPTTCEPYILHARVRIADANVAKGLSELADAAETVSDRVPCLEALVTLANREHDEPRASAAIAKIAANGCTDDSECAQNLAWIADVEERKGNSQQALVFYKRAYDRSPDNDELLKAVARLAASSGLHTEALRDYERLARRHPEQSNWRKAADEQRDAALRSTTER
jgi:tetratricopeptide (TPR) repeat protein